MSDTPIFDEMLMDLPETHAVFELDPGAVLVLDNAEDAESILTSEEDGDKETDG